MSFFLGKPGLPDYPNQMWLPTVSKTTASNNSLSLQLTFPTDASSLYGAPQILHIKYDFDDHEKRIGVSVIFWNKTSIFHTLFSEFLVQNIF